jgi:hypothetical protein
VPIPIFRISFQNATILSVAYLLMAMAIEASRKWLPFRWTDRAVLTVEWIPARTLDTFGLYEPIRQAVLDDRMSNFTVRLIFGATSVVAIFFVALGVGISMWLGRWLLSRRDRNSQGRPSLGP